MPDLTAFITPTENQASTFLWATVTATSPLRIKIAGATTALAITPQSSVSGLTVGDAVRVEISPQGNLIVVGRLGGSQLANPNLFANPIFRINQRGATSGASLASGQYFLGRMKSTTPGNAVTWTGDDTQGRVLTIPAGGKVALVQERADHPAGAYTISWGGTAPARFQKVGSSAATLASGPITLVTDGSDDLIAEFGAGTLSWIKIEQGTVATPLVLTSRAVEDQLCRRYCVAMSAPQYYMVTTMGVMASTTAADIHVSLSAPMRATPTVTSSNLGVFDGQSVVALSSLSVRNTPRLDDIVLRATVATALGAYRPAALMTVGAGNGWLLLDCEP